MDPQVEEAVNKWRNFFGLPTVNTDGVDYEYYPGIGSRSGDYYLRVDGKWVKAKPYVRQNGQWVQTK